MKINKININKYYLYLINLFLLFNFLSCYKYIPIEWRVIEEPTDKKIVLNLLNHNDIEVIINETKYIKIPNDAIYFGRYHSGCINIFIRPDLNLINNKEKIEIFVFPYYTEKEILNNKIKISFIENEDVLSYFYRFYTDNKIYIAISRKNQFIIDINNIFIEVEPTIMDISFFTNIDNLYIFYDEISTAFYNENFNDHGGYIVKSNINDSIIWLDRYMF